MKETMKKKGVLLINLGTPKSPKVKDVGVYLFEFLNDYRVIDIPWILRKILVNFIIVPFRSFRSSKEYKKLWTEKGSPLAFHSQELLKKVGASKVLISLTHLSTVASAVVILVS